VHVAVEEVPVLTDQTSGSRGRVVCPEDRAQVRLALEDFVHPSECIRMETSVGIHEHEDIAAGSIRSSIAGKGRPTWSTYQSQQLIGVRSRDLGRSILARVVDHDQLPAILRQVTCSECVQRVGQKVRSIAHRNDD
jgi:hypothetical protein